MGINQDNVGHDKPMRASPNIIISNLPEEATSRSISQFAESVGPTMKCFLVRDKDHVFTGMAYVSFENSETAAEAVKVLNHCTFDGVTVNVKLSKPKQYKNDKDTKPIPVRTIEDQGKESQCQNKRGYLKVMRSKVQNGRIVIRNINRGCTEEGVRKLFAVYGEILEFVMLKLSDGRPKGVAFIQYGSAKHASEAISKCNGSKFMGKTIAVDLAVPKDVYQTQEPKSDILPAVKEEPIDIIKDNKHIKKFKDDDDDMDESVESNALSEGKSGVTDFVEEEESEEESDDEENQKRMELDELLSKNKNNKKLRKQESDFVHKAQSNDILEKRSLFIRSIAFDCNEETVAKLLSKFGEVKHVLFCRDRDTKRFKGTAFAQFKTREGSDACLEAYEDPAYKKEFVLNGRTLYISIAVAREDLQKVKEKGKDIKKDKRNLYLAKEGLIKEGTKAADGLSKNDLSLRKQRAIVSKKILQNLHIFISPTRLSIHNLDLDLSDVDLRKIFLGNSPAGAEIVECRIMRNMYELDDNGKPRSKGYGFVNFTKPENALAALRQLNNNPDIFTPMQRPIVEFSHENRAALNAKDRRLQKSKEKNWGTREYKKAEQAKLEKEEEMQKSNAEPSVYTPTSYAGNQAHPTKKSKKITRNQVNNTMRKQFKENKNRYAKKKAAGKSSSKSKSKGAGGPAKKKRKI